MFKYMILIAGILGQVCGSGGDGSGGGVQIIEVKFGNHISNQAPSLPAGDNKKQLKLQYAYMGSSSIILNDQYLILNISDKTNPSLSEIHLTDDINLNRYGNNGNKLCGYYFAKFMIESYSRILEVTHSNILSAILEIVKTISQTHLHSKAHQLFSEGILAYFNGEREDLTAQAGFKLGNLFRQTFQTEWGQKITEIKNTIQSYIDPKSAQSKAIEPKPTGNPKPGSTVGRFLGGLMSGRKKS